MLSVSSEQSMGSSSVSPQTWIRWWWGWGQTALRHSGLHLSLPLWILLLLGKAVRVPLTWGYRLLVLVVGSLAEFALPVWEASEYGLEEITRSFLLGLMLMMLILAGAVLFLMVHSGLPGHLIREGWGHLRQSFFRFWGRHSPRHSWVLLEIVFWGLTLLRVWGPLQLLNRHLPESWSDWWARTLSPELEYQWHEVYYGDNTPWVWSSLIYGFQILTATLSLVRWSKSPNLHRFLIGGHLLMVGVTGYQGEYGESWNHLTTAVASWVMLDWLKFDQAKMKRDLTCHLILEGFKLLRHVRELPDYLSCAWNGTQTLISALGGLTGLDSLKSLWGVLGQWWSQGSRSPTSLFVDLDQQTQKVKQTLDSMVPTENWMWLSGLNHALLIPVALSFLMGHSEGTVIWVLLVLGLSLVWHWSVIPEKSAYSALVHWYLGGTLYGLRKSLLTPMTQVRATTTVVSYSAQSLEFVWDVTVKSGAFTTQTLMKWGVELTSQGSRLVNHVKENAGWYLFGASVLSGVAGLVWWRRR